MSVREPGVEAVARAIPFTANDTDRWNAVAMLVLLMTLTLGGLLHLLLRAGGS